MFSPAVPEGGLTRIPSGGSFVCPNICVVLQTAARRPGRRGGGGDAGVPAVRAVAGGVA